MTLYFILLLLAAGLFFLHRHFRNYVPILMYHRIASISGDRNALPPAKFARQLEYLQKSGFTTITPQELFDAYTGKGKLPKKPILLTFDDGYADNYSEAMPLLACYKMKATVFPIAGWVGKRNAWENFHKAPTRTMTWEELDSWKKQGLQIETHTFDHPFLTNCPPERLAKELSDSRSLLQETLQLPMNFLCYPYGFFDETVQTAAREAGYLGAFAIFDHVPIWQKNLYALPRIQIPAHQSMWEFRLKVSSVHMLFVAFRKWERDFKRKFRNKS